MIRNLTVVFVIACCTFSQYALSQDTLPRFTVTTRGSNKVLISWTNNYPVVSQISIQRSFDSTRNFKTILTVPDPKVPQNGFVDTKASTAFMFYRLFIVLDSGKYLFSTSRRPFWDTAKVVKDADEVLKENADKRVVVSEDLTKKEVKQLEEKLEVEPEPVPEPEKFFVVQRRDSLLEPISEKNFRPFRDSIVYRTKDTLVFKSIDTILIKPFIPKEIYKASKFVYTERDGNIMISLPDAAAKTYSIRFFEEDNTSLFEIAHVKEPTLILDKTNFQHAGWFRFELYENGELKEKHRFFIPKDF